MQNIEIKIKRITRGEMKGRRPEKATPGSAGFDLYAAIEKPLTIRPGDLAKIPTGIAIGLPEGYAGFVFARSGLSVKHGIALSNGVGVIDSDYTGEIMVGLCNLSGEPYSIRPEERIAQLVVMQVPFTGLIEVENLDETGRGEQGFGSTGKF